MRKLVVLALLGLLLASPAAAQQYQAVLKLASALAMDHPYMRGGKRLSEVIQERTKGRIVIKLYPSGQLGKGEREMTEGLQQGAIDLLVTSTGPLGGFSPSINILDFPYLFRDFQHVDAVLDGAAGRRLLDDFDKAGIKALAFWENGFRHLTNSRRPIRKVEDGRGLKIRTMENRVHLAAWKAAGFNPTPMSWGEVFTALQQRVIDGQENPIAVLAISRLWEAGQRYFSFTAHVYSPALLLMSKKAFEALPQADQALFQAAALEVAKYQRRINRDEEEARLAEAARHGVVVTRDVDRDGFRRAMVPVYDEFRSLFDRAQLEAIRNVR